MTADPLIDTVRQALWHLNMMEPRFRNDMFPARDALDALARRLEAAETALREIADYPCSPRWHESSAHLQHYARAYFAAQPASEEPA